MYKYLLRLVIILLLCSASGRASDRSGRDPLIIFHLDFNSVSLREEYIRHWLKNAAEMGYNAVLWEIEDEVKWQICPECASPDAFSKEQFRELLEYSRGLGLEPIPLLQTIGHAEYVLRHVPYQTMRENPGRYDCYCTSNPRVRHFLKSWIREYLELFGPVRYFHLGGDEAYAFGSCPLCSLAVTRQGANGLYSEYIRDIAESLIRNGIRPGVWSDMVLKHPATLSLIPKDFIFWDWNYWDGEGSPEEVMVWSMGRRVSGKEITAEVSREFPGIIDSTGALRAFYTSDRLKSLGYEVILCSSSRSHGDGVFAGRHAVHAPNIVAAARKCVQADLLGTCITSWAVRISNYETQQPWFHLAPLTCKNPHLPLRELLRLTGQALFGADSSAFFTAITGIGQPFPFGSEKTTGIMWTGMKDGRPAPPGHLRELVRAWRSAGDGARWQQTKGDIAMAGENIQTGLDLLNRMILSTQGGSSIMNAWSRAGYFQLWQLYLADELVRHAEGAPLQSNHEMAELAGSLRREYRAWAEEWMTPASADQNAGLIYDAIIDFFTAGGGN
ncbi:MAG TPA: family 20 glycosylhydrolase [bacterium]|nr:family 20 glycosylhydrolase [bacterium]